MALAGRASEQVYFGSFTTGGSDDIKRVTQIVYQMISTYGMSEKVKNSFTTSSVDNKLIELDNI